MLALCVLGSQHLRIRERCFLELKVWYTVPYVEAMLLATHFAGKILAAKIKRQKMMKRLCLLYRRLGAGAQKMLEEYVKVQGGLLSSVLQGATPYRSQKAEKQPDTQGLIRSVLKMLSQSEAEISALLKKKGTTTQTRCVAWLWLSVPVS